MSELSNKERAELFNLGSIEGYEIGIAVATDRACDYICQQCRNAYANDCKDDTCDIVKGLTNAIDKEE